MLLFENQSPDPDAVVPDLAEAAPLSSVEVLELELQVSRRRADAVNVIKLGSKSSRAGGAAMATSQSFKDATSSGADADADATYPPAVPPSLSRRAAVARTLAWPAQTVEQAERVAAGYKWAKLAQVGSMEQTDPIALAALSTVATEPTELVLSPSELSVELSSFLDEEAVAAAGYMEADGFDKDAEIASLRDELSDSGGETPMECSSSTEDLLSIAGNQAFNVAEVASEVAAEVANVTPPQRQSMPATRATRATRASKSRNSTAIAAAATAAAADNNNNSSIKRKTKGGRRSQATAERTSSRRSPAPGKTKRSAGMAGKSATKAAAASSKAGNQLPVVAFDISGVLPKDHKPARGRGRHLQLKAMTPEQIEAESIARQEKNRLAARECRMRRKNHVSGLEDRIAELERKERQSQATIAKLRAKLAEYERKKK